jgi:hypothetical protein
MEKRAWITPSAVGCLDLILRRTIEFRDRND